MTETLVKSYQDAKTKLANFNFIPKSGLGDYPEYYGTTLRIPYNRSGFEISIPIQFTPEDIREILEGEVEEARKKTVELMEKQ